MQNKFFILTLFFMTALFARHDFRTSDKERTVAARDALFCLHESRSNPAQLKNLSDIYAQHPHIMAHAMNLLAVGIKDVSVEDAAWLIEQCGLHARIADAYEKLGREEALAHRTWIEWLEDRKKDSQGTAIVAGAGAAALLVVQLGAIYLFGLSVKK